MNNPLSLRSMNRERLGDLGTACDISIEPGWVGIIEKLYAALERLPPDERPVILQIKEKFGELRVYVAGSDRRVEDAIRRAEGEAARSCQFCGCRGRMRRSAGWYATLCDVHAEKANRRSDPPAPGADDPPHRVLLAVGTKPMSETMIPSIGIGVVGEEGACERGMATEFLRGFVEKSTVVLALDPEAVAQALAADGGPPLPFVPLDARTAFRELALSKGLDPDGVERRIDEFPAADALDRATAGLALWTELLETKSRD
jgi:hypothetical protein